MQRRIARHCLAATLLSAIVALPGGVRAQAPAPAAKPPAAEAARPVDWRETYAYATGLQAYVFGFPWAFMAQQRWGRTYAPEGLPDNKAPVNQFAHSRNLRTAAHRLGGSPNNDTLYSNAWLNVAREPVILSHPDMGSRYFTFEIASMDSDNFAYVGQRVTGSAAGAFAIVGPNWKGELPPGVKALPPSRTNSVLVFGRTLVDGPADTPVVNALQNQYQLTPLSRWGKPEAAPGEPIPVWQPANRRTDPLADWKNMNRAMTEDPPEARHKPLLDQFARIGVGPGQDVEKMDEATKRGLARAAADGFALLNQLNASAALAEKVNGWNYPPRHFGRAGLKDDFLLRASMQSLGGIIANDPEENLYLFTFTDIAGKPLEGNKRYAMRFAPGQLPKVRAFWSLTMNDMTYNLVDNPINRYSIGDRTKGLVRDADGGLTLHIQNAPPGSGRDGNWLPSPASGNFYMVMRTYLPDDEIVEHRWIPPAVTPVD